MPPGSSNPALAQVIVVVRTLIEELPPADRPPGLDRLADLLTELGAQAGSADLSTLREALGEAAPTLDALLAEVDMELVAERPGADRPPIDPQVMLEQGRRLAEAWGRQDGAEVDRLLATLEPYAAATRSRQEQARRSRIQSTVADSIADSLRAHGVTPSRNLSKS